MLTKIPAGAGFCVYGPGRATCSGATFIPYCDSQPPRLLTLPALPFPSLLARRYCVPELTPLISLRTGILVVVRALQDRTMLGPLKLTAEVGQPRRYRLHHHRCLGAPRGSAVGRPKLESRTLNGQIGVVDLPMSIWGRWFRDDWYGDLRNTAWFVRNYRMVGHDDNVAIAKLCYAVKMLFETGEPVEAVVPSLVDLFLRP
jgi:hypothetical protein